MTRTRTLALLLAALASPAMALNIQFDYTFDTSGFFAGPNVSRRDLLNQAAGTFSVFADNLSTITPSGQNTWNATFTNPSTGANQSISNPTIPANTVIIYVGARDLGGNTLGQGGPGGFNASGFQPWFDTIRKRGQAGAPSSSGDLTATDNAPWGGSLAFDTDSNWFFSPKPQGQPGTSSDFLSVAIHELGHLLGFGTANSFKHWTTGVNPAALFTGPASETAFGPLGVPTPVPLDSIAAHWNQTVSGDRAPNVAAQNAAMTPAILQGTRKVFTDLDYAAMKDIGWQVNVPNMSLPGDANADGVINSADLTALLNGINNKLSGWHNGDFNGDGLASTDDLALFNLYAASHGTAETAVPEPTALASLTLLPLTRRRR